MSRCGSKLGGGELAMRRNGQTPVRVITYLFVKDLDVTDKSAYPRCEI